MNKAKKLLSLVLSLTLIAGLAACEMATDNAGPEPSQDQTEESQTELSPETTETEDQATAGEESAVDPELTLTLEERQAGTVLYFPVGAKFTLTDTLNQNANYISRKNRGFEVGPDAFIESSRGYYFRPDGRSQDKQERYKDIDSSQFPIFGVVYVDKKRQPEDPEELKEKLYYHELELVAEYGDYAQYYGYGVYDQAPTNLLDESEQEIYRKLLAEVDKVKETMYLFKPQQPNESIGSVRNWTFESQDLAGKPVDQTIFADNDLTLVTYMTTWCPYCIEELPLFAEADRTYLKEEFNAGVLAIVADLVPEESDHEGYDQVLAEAGRLLDEAQAEFPAILNSYSIQDSLSKYAMNYPTNFFVDSKGNVLSVHVGSYPDLKAAFRDAKRRAAKLAADPDYDFNQESASLELTDQEVADILADPQLSLSPEELEDNYTLLIDVGAKFRLPEAYAPFAPYTTRSRGEGVAKPLDLIRKSQEYYYNFRPDQLNKYLEYPLFGLFVLNKENLPAEEAELQEILGFSQLKKTYEDDYVVQYLALGAENIKDLGKSDLKPYRELLEQAKEVEASLYSFRALGIQDSLGRIKGLELEAKNLDNEAWGPDQLQAKPVTLISYMTTWCHFCVEEIPVLEEVQAENSESFQVIYLVADYQPDQLEEDRKAQMLEDLAKLFPDPETRSRVLAQNDQAKSAIGKYVEYFPTNILVDSQGNVVKVKVGGYDKNSLKSDLKDLFEQMNQAK